MLSGSPDYVQMSETITKRSACLSYRSCFFGILDELELCTDWPPPDLTADRLKTRGAQILAFRYN